MSAPELNIAATKHYVLAAQKHHSICTMNLRSSGHVMCKVDWCKVCTSNIEGAGMGVFSTEIVQKERSAWGTVGRWWQTGRRLFSCAIFVRTCTCVALGPSSTAKFPDARICCQSTLQY